MGDSPCSIESLPRALVGTYEVRTVYNGKDTLAIAAERFSWKGAHVAPREVLLDYLESGGVRLRFTVFCPNQSTEWLRGAGGGPLVCVIESFDILFEPGGKTKLGLYSTFRGDFRRQGEGILPTKAIARSRSTSAWPACRNSCARSRPTRRRIAPSAWKFGTPTTSCRRRRSAAIRFARDASSPSAT